MFNVNYKIAHITLLADDEQHMRSFYRDMLGLVERKKAQNQFSYAFTSQDQPFLTLTFTGRKPSQQRQGLYHFALLFPDKASLASLIERLILSEYPLGTGDHDVSEAFYLNDPNGNGIELYHDRPTELWEWDKGFVKMGTKAVDVLSLLQTKQADWSGFPVGMTIGHLHFVGDSVHKGDAFFINMLQMSLTAKITESAHFYAHNAYHHHHAYNTWFGPNVARRRSDENGLVDWTILVDKQLFTILQHSLHDQNHSTQPSQICLVDPFGSRLLINEDYAKQM